MLLATRGALICLPSALAASSQVVAQLVALGIIVPTSDLLSIKRSINFFIQARLMRLCSTASSCWLRALPRRHTTQALHCCEVLPVLPLGWSCTHQSAGVGMQQQQPTPCPLLHPFAAQNINRQAQQQEAVSTIGGEQGGRRGLLDK